MRTPHKKRLLTIGLIVLALAAASVFVGRTSEAPGSQYFTYAVDRGPLRNVVNATGVVQTVVTVQVGSQVSGQVEELHADFNSIVKRGQLLAKIDPRNFEAQVQNSRANVTAVEARVKGSEADLKNHAANLQSSKANLVAAKVTRDNAVNQFNRVAELSQNGLGSKNEYDNAKANADSSQAKYEQALAAVAQVEAQGGSVVAQIEQTKAQLAQAQADLDRALLNLEYCNIYSPVDGVVISRSIDVGQTIAASMQTPTLFSIANDLTRMQVHASVDEADIGIVSSAENVQFTVDAYPNDVFKGKIAEIRLSPQTVQNVVTYAVILGIDNSEMKLRPGMTANIAITVDERENAVKIPNSAIRYTPTGFQRDALKDAVSETAAPTDQGKPEIPAFAAGEGNRPALALAPGQKWDPAGKIQFVRPERATGRAGIAFVLNASQQPEARHVVFGITDGSYTEILSGDLKPGDLVIVGDDAATVATNLQGAARNRAPSAS
jgi:HlyD family secretion protein